jgi:hypothetical protein
MCDYSLGEIRSRLAVEGETLVVHRFPTHTVGLASVADLAAAKPQCNAPVWTRVKAFLSNILDSSRAVPAVCVPPGASLILSGIPAHIQSHWQVGTDEVVTFTQTSMNVHTHRDAVRFRNGRDCSLQLLAENIRVKVVSLGEERTPDHEPVRETTVR